MLRRRDITIAPHSLTAIVVGFVASVLVTGCATAPDPLPIVRNYDEVPMMGGPALGSVVGKCVVFEASQPVVKPCRVSLAALTQKAKRVVQRNRSTFTHGVYRSTDPHIAAGGFGVAFELATYGGTNLTWLPEPSLKTVAHFADRCGIHDGSSTYLVEREIAGCGFVGDANRNSQAWSIPALAERGSVVGKPDGFWAQAPEGPRPTADAKCSDKRVVSVRLVPWMAICKRFKLAAAELEAVEAERLSASADRGDALAKLPQPAGPNVTKTGPGAKTAPALKRKKRRRYRRRRAKRKGKAPRTAKKK